MSFLVSDSAEDPTLCELLEIVDTWAPGTPARGVDGPSRWDSPSASSVTSGSCDASGGSDAAASKTRKRTRNPEADVRRRLKKKKERLELASLAQDLERRLEQLRQQCRCECGSSVKAEQPACGLCLQLDDVLAAALRDNQQLKSEARKNAMLIRVLHDAVSTPTVEMGLTADVIATAMSMHRSALQEMYMDLGAAFKSFPVLSANEPFFFRSDTKFDGHGSLRVELSTALYVPWDLRRASSHLVSGLVLFSPFGRAVSSCLEAQAELSEQEYELDCRAPNTSPGLQSIGLVQKRQNDNSMVFMWSSQIFHPTAGIAFVGRARIRVTAISSELTMVEALTNVSATELPNSAMSESIDSVASMSVRNALVGAFGNRVGFKHKAFLKRMLALSGKSHFAAAIMM